MPNRAPSSSAKLATPIGRVGREPLRRAAASTAARADDHPERAVEGAAVGHRVQVRADDQPGPAGRHGGVGVAPPRPLVAGAVLDEVEATRGASPANHSRSVVSSRVQANRR